MARQRITDRDLQGLCDTLNHMTSNPAEPWSRDAAGKLRANVGNFHISGAYGGVSLQQMVDDGGSVRTMLNSHTVTKRELYNKMHAFLDGLEYAEKSR